MIICFFMSDADYVKLAAFSRNILLKDISDLFIQSAKVLVNSLSRKICSYVCVVFLKL